MHNRMRVLAGLVLIVLPRPLLGQGHWGITGEVGAAQFSGHAHSVSGLETTGHPAAASTWGIRLDHGTGRARLSVGLLYSTTGVEFESDDLVAGVKNLLTLLEISPELSWQALHAGACSVRFHGGMVIDRWSPDGDPARTALGGLAALSLEAPLSHRANIAVRWEATLTQSVFDDNDLPADFERKQGFRRRLGIGIRFSL
ncbi:MAG: hypothetical protein ABI679_04890 [Gemmatimonadota bacterium]